MARGLGLEGPGSSGLGRGGAMGSLGGRVVLCEAPSTPSDYFDGLRRRRAQCNWDVGKATLARGGGISGSDFNSIFHSIFDSRV